MTRVLLLILCGSTAIGADSAIGRAVAYLVSEVPRWPEKNHCFSCHNNGDAARALQLAKKRGYEVPEKALASTTEWLMKPQEWGAVRSSEGSSDKKLARIQFAAALADAAESGAALATAAAELAPLQDADGSWRVDGDTALGSPVTYGAPLATYMARRTLERADASKYAGRIAHADAWLRGAPTNSVLDAASVVLALHDRGPEKAQRAAEFVLRAQGSDGGWGPYPHAPAEVFDTAIALLALVKRAGVADSITRGRAYLIAAQLRDGGWQGTTRPSGAQSYAQHISTCGWATLALLETETR